MTGFEKQKHIFSRQHIEYILEKIKPRHDEMHKYLEVNKYADANEVDDEYNIAHAIKCELEKIIAAMNADRDGEEGCDCEACQEEIFINNWTPSDCIVLRNEYQTIRNYLLTMKENGHGKGRQK